MKRTSSQLAAAALVATLATAGSAAAATHVTVSGKADPYFTGQTSASALAADSSASYGGDTLAVDQPADGGIITKGKVVITATGKVTNDVSYPLSAYNDPNGGYSITSNNYGSFSLVGAQYTHPINSLVGVFYNPSCVGACGDVNKIIEIGSSFSLSGADLKGSHLYLGTWDGYQWSNNAGSFDVIVSSVPEPATWMMMLVGFGSLGAALRMRRRAMPANAAA